ncbi:MAG: hypothetical protein PHG02_01460 [Oscillospiraceae bacterium]|nr:hypothetical protein [Oscillospiraceae bacterium]
MNPIYFSAVLKIQKGEVLELGQAYLEEEENAVNFCSEFVPLLKLGTTAYIYRTLGDKEMECFTGRVYLSSRKRLQIVDVSPDIMQAARSLFDVNVNLATELYLAPGRSAHFKTEKAEKISGFVRYLSTDTVKICTMEFVDKGQYLMFSAEGMSLMLDHMLVLVRERTLLMRNSAILICDIVSLSAQNREALNHFLACKKKSSTKP